MARVTMRDVAERAGVSVKTVSNVVNGTGWVTEQTRESVQQSLNDLNYRINASARQLRSGRSGLIAVALPELDQPYFAELAAEFVAAANERDLTLLLNQTDGQAERERSISDAEGMPAIDGLILSAMALTSSDLLDRRDTGPLVIMGEQDGTSPFPHVTIENEHVATTATEFLLSRGERRIAVIGAQPQAAQDTSTLRLRGYARALQGAGIEVDTRLIGEVTSFSRLEGYRAAIALIDSGADFDAILCFSDLLAIGAMRALRERNIAIPREVSVIGIDDIEEGTFSYPSLTTVSFSKRLVAEKSLDLVQSMQTSTPSIGTTIVIPHHIVERESTK